MRDESARSGSPRPFAAVHPVIRIPDIAQRFGHDERLSAIAALGPDAPSAPPILLARAGRDDPAINSTIDRFVTAAKSARAKVELLTHPTGRHAFDILDPGETSSQIIQRTLQTLRNRLGAGPMR